MLLDKNGSDMESTTQLARQLFALSALLSLILLVFIIEFNPTLDPSPKIPALLNGENSELYARMILISVFALEIGSCFDATVQNKPTCVGLAVPLNIFKIVLAILVIH
jgi:hypothetical protein